MRVKLKVSDKCLTLIKSFEGFRAKPYLCPAHVPTIGYGSTKYPRGTPVRLTDPPITEEQATHILLSTLASYESAVTGYVRQPINQTRFDALVDFAYNVGSENLRTSTLLRKINAGDVDGAADEFACSASHPSAAATCSASGWPGLVRRREAERNLFLGAT